MTRRHKVLLLGSLYLAQGLPYGFFTQALPVLLRDAGYSLKAISATSLLFLPWALKFAVRRPPRHAQVVAVAVAVCGSGGGPGAVAN